MCGPILGQFLPSPYSSSDFAAQVEQVEVDFGPMGSNKFGPWTVTNRNSGRESSRNIEDQAKLFWDTLLGRFPSVKRVVLTDGVIVYDFYLSIMDLYILVIRAAPSNVSVFDSATKGGGETTGHERNLYQLDGNSKWILLRNRWTRLCVLLPDKNVSGPIGICLREWRKSWNFRSMASALRRIRIEAHEKYHFGGGGQIPFRCPHPDCGRVFEHAGEFTKHVASIDGLPSHDGWDNKTLRKYPDFHSSLPMGLEEQLDELRAAYIEGEQRHTQKMEELGKEEGGWDTPEKRRLFKERFLAQLQHEPEWMCPDDPKQHVLWRQIERVWGMTGIPKLVD
jgi:hypothetical protein